MANGKRYEKAALAAIGITGNNADDFRDPRVHAVMTVAYDLDEITERIAYASESIARDFARYAAEVRDGRALSTAPTGSSLLRDLDADVATCRARHDEMARLLLAAYGKETRSAYRVELERLAAATHPAVSA